MNEKQITGEERKTDSELLRVEDLRIEYRTDRETVHAVNGISFSLNREETLGFVGETGAGKTTTALALMRLLSQPVGQIAGGHIYFEGQDLAELKDIEMRCIRGEKMSMIFQDPMTSLNPIMTVGDQIKEALMLHSPDKSMKKGKYLNRRVDEVLEMVGIPADRRNDYPIQFSGGMKQRIVIAMALACSPDLLIADEPTTALDVTIQAQVLALMNELKEKMHTAMIMITHDLGIVANTCDNVAVIYSGEIIEYGTIYDIFEGDIHHPYTAGLFHSIPRMDEKTDRLTPIEGLMPNPAELPKGCNFCPRCSHRCSRCETEEPGYYISGTHKIKCFLYSGEEAK